VGSAASILIAAVLSTSGVSKRMTAWLTEKAPIVSPETGELAVAWSQTRQELSVASDAGLWFPDHLDAVTSDAVTSEDAAASDNREDSAALAAPSWLTAAVLSSAGLPVDGDTTPFDGERREN
jgi:hypothetical protein